MWIESVCPGCGRTLRVTSRQAGQRARCPVCNTISTVSQYGAAGPDPENGAQPQWRLRTPDGRIYGPVDAEQLETWVTEGRVTAECEIEEGGAGVWQSADAVYPVLGAPRTAAASGANRKSAVRYRYTAAHRGVLVLVMGVLSWFTGCAIFGLAAWLLGNSDLREMRAGRMDPRGQGLTQAGQILGMIHVFVLLALLVAVFCLLLAGVAIR